MKSVKLHQSLTVALNLYLLNKNLGKTSRLSAQKGIKLDLLLDFLEDIFLDLSSIM